MNATCKLLTETKMHSNNKSCINFTVLVSADDWADKASENGSSADDAGGGGSGDDASESMDTDSGEGNAEASIAKKQKKQDNAAAAVKKTHLNIVFIGHVGE